MELNQIKLFGRIIDLEVGDLFWSNDGGKSINYSPKGNNLAKIPRGNDRWHFNTYVSCQKYIKEIKAADNLKLFDYRTSRAHSHSHYEMEWVVQYVYKQDHPEFEDLIVMKINSKDFTVEEVAVVRETDKFIFVTPRHPITYLSRIEKQEFLRPLYHYHAMYGMCRPDDYSKLEKILFDAFEEKLATERRQLIQSVFEKEKEIEQFTNLRKEYGFVDRPKLQRKNKSTKLN